MATTTYTVKKGDTLSEIAQKFLKDSGYSSIWDYVDRLVELNDLVDSDFIVVGQVLKLSGEADKTKPNTTSRATIKEFGIQSNTDRTLFITWSWDKKLTEKYQVVWYYDSGDGIWFEGSDSEVKTKYALYNAPNNALKVKVKVKPISQTFTTDGVDGRHWSASWSTEKIYDFKDAPPTKPPTPSAKIEKFKLTAELTNIDLNATHIEFQVVANDIAVAYSGRASISKSAVSYSCTVAAGSRYKVRCRSVRGTLKSDWTDYTANMGTIPSTPKGLKECRASSETSIYLSWTAVSNATSYDIEYTTKKTYFDGSDQTTVISNIEFTHYDKSGFTSGEEYFFRIRAVNNEGASGWSKISSVTIGKPPAAPTTWSSTTTAIVGEPLTLYWLHNSEDASKQMRAQLNFIIDGVYSSAYIGSPENKDDEPVTFYSINTTKYTEGTTIEWQVRTCGITFEYSPWSTTRTVKIYAPPSMELNVYDTNDQLVDILDSYPFYISAITYPETQIPVGYCVSIIAEENHTTVDSVGNEKFVNKGDEIYSHYYDVQENLMIEMSANNLSLENNMTYTIKCLAYMDSGLVAEGTYRFTTAWTDEEYEPNAEIAINKETYTAYIRPYCNDGYDNTVPDVTLSVYRREFDGSFTELGSGLDNDKNIFVTDPHPALDYARYRVVAKTNSTGKISYYDIPGQPVGGKAAIIQWDEDWSGFDVTEESRLEQRPWTGSMLVLPYNIDVSDSYKTDTSLVEYIGRKYPVSYYGTQVSTTSSWSMQILKSDKETLYGLRRLANWMGDVYVREPSGSGYWANVTVSFNQKHRATTIPVSISITRVAGGV
jgi:LysM repeat protein